MVFQSLNIFKSKSEPVSGDDLARLTPKAQTQTPVAVATAESDAQIVQRGTAKHLKDVENPSQGDIEADFAFMNEILSKAGVADAPSAARPAPRTDPAPQAQPRTPSIPKHVPHHKRGSAADKSKPVFAVQEAPRAATAPTGPAPTQVEEVSADVDLPTDLAPTLSPADVYGSIVGAEDDAQLALPFDACEPAEAAGPEAMAAVASVQPEAKMSPAAVAEPKDAHLNGDAGEQVSKPDAAALSDALAILGMRQSDDAATAPKASAANPGEQNSVAAVSLERPEKPSVFAKRPKAAKATQREIYDVDSDGDDAEAGMPPVGIEPPALVRRLMAVLPATDIPQGVSDFAKARLARDPFDRLMDDARHA